MKIKEEKIKQILLDGNYVKKKDIDRADDFAKKHHLPFTEYLFRNDLITKDLLGEAIAESMNLSYADLNSLPPTYEQVHIIPKEVAVNYRAVFFNEENDVVTVATDEPMNSELLTALDKVFPNKKLSIAYSLTEDIDANLLHYKKHLKTRFREISEKKDRVGPELLEEIFADAIAFRASDIHFEPGRKEVLIRFRVDGVLHEAGIISEEHYETILNHVKIKSRLPIDEHFRMQDGSFQYEKDNEIIDLRLSIIPTVKGQKLALRVLAKYVRGFSLNDIGLSDEHQETLRRFTSKSFGMILVAGPTGSGKTTTLYSLMKMVNEPEVNITTIEDPVEYKIDGINQIQVNHHAGITFAKGLRSIVRQDPDVILVGEIRDDETAGIAINAALTGHILYSTFHANDTATVIPRLIDMGVEPFLLASTLDVIVAQRLVRKICESCKHSVALSAGNLGLEQMKKVFPYFKEKNISLYEGKKCQACGHTGYKDRTALFEFIKITPEMKDLILKSPSTEEVRRLARKQGSKSLFEDGIEKAKMGITTIEEVFRVAEPPQE